MKEIKRIREAQEEQLEEDLMIFPEELNQELFEGDHLKEEVRNKLIEIGYRFYETFDLHFDIIDMYFEGSMAQYNWVDLKNINGVEGLDYKSDIDLHLVVDFNAIDMDNEVLTDYFISKKQVFNEYHNITIKGFEVELGCEDSNTPLHSQGVYSLFSDEWIKKPSPVSVEVENIRDTADYNEFRTYVIDTIKSENFPKAKDLWDKIKYMRKKSLDIDGEFGKGNLIFKALRQERLLDLLWNFIHNEEDKKLSLLEDYNKSDRFQEIVDPSQIMERDDEDFSEEEWIEGEDVNARISQISQISRSYSYEIKDDGIYLKFPDGNDDIGYEARIYMELYSHSPHLGWWSVYIEDCSYGGFGEYYSTQDIINVFGISEKVVNEYREYIAEHDLIAHKDKAYKHFDKFAKNNDIIEESIIETSDLNELLRKLEEVSGLESWYSTIDPKSEGFTKVKEILVNRFNEKIVEYAIKYINSTNHIDPDEGLEGFFNPTITLYKLGRICLVIATIANHVEEELLYLNNYTRIDLINSQNWRVGTVLRDSGGEAFNVYEDISDDETMSFYDVTARELVEVFNVKNTDLLTDLVSHVDNELLNDKDEYKDVIEESFTEERAELISQYHNLLQKINATNEGYIIKEEDYPIIFEELKNDFDLKILEYTKTIFDRYSSKPTIEAFIHYLTNYQKLANHTEEHWTAGKTKLIVDDFVITPCKYDFDIKLIDGLFWEDSVYHAIILHDIFNISKENVEKLVELKDKNYQKAQKTIDNNLLGFDKEDIIEESVEKEQVDSILDRILSKVSRNWEDISNNVYSKNRFVVEEDMYPIIYKELKPFVKTKILDFVKSNQTINGYRPTLASFVKEALIVQDVANHYREEFLPNGNLALLGNDLTSEYIVDTHHGLLEVRQSYLTKDNYWSYYPKHVRELHDIFNISIDNVSKVHEQNERNSIDFQKRHLNYFNKEDIIEESVSKEDNISLNILSAFLKTFGIDKIADPKVYEIASRYKFDDVLTENTFNQVKKELAQIYDPKIVNFVGNYMLSYFGNEIQSISIILLIKYCVEAVILASHTKERVIDNFIKLYVPTTDEEYEVQCYVKELHPHYHILFKQDAFWNISIEDLVKIFNVNKENIEAITQEALSDDSIEYTRSNDIIEESFNKNSKESILLDVMKTFTFKDRFTSMCLTDKKPILRKRLDSVINYLKDKYFDEKIIDFVIRQEIYRGEEYIDLVNLISHCSDVVIIASHNIEKVKGNEIILKRNSINCGKVSSETETCTKEQNFCVELCPSYWRDVNIKDIIEIFNVKSENCLKILQTEIDNAYKKDKELNPEEYAPDEIEDLDECCSATCAGDVAATVLPFGGIGSKYKAKKDDWKKSAEEINKEIEDNMV